MPVRVAFQLIDAYARYSRRVRTRQYKDYLRYHRALLRYTPLAGQEEDVAERAIAEYWQCSELFWRPWLMHRGEIDGFEYFRSARAAERGVVAVFPHFGIPYAQFPIMRRHGIDAWVSAAPHHYDGTMQGYDGMYSRHGRSYVDLLGPGRGIPRFGGSRTFSHLAELLRDDAATVSVTFDSVGSMPTPFMGRKPGLVSGPSRLARETDAMVVPFVIRRRGALPILTFAPPLDPRDFEDPTALQEAIAAIMERWALELPEAVWALEQQPGGPPLIKGPKLDAAPA